MSIFNPHIHQIRNLCSEHKVSSLFVFGSSLSSDVNSKSDIDFMVNFSGVELYNYVENYFNLKFSLQNLLEREVDLIEEKAIKNPFMLKSLNEIKELIYGSMI